MSFSPLSDTPIVEAITLDCGHGNCIDCFKGYVTDKIMDGRVQWILNPIFYLPKQSEGMSSSSDHRQVESFVSID